VDGQAAPHDRFSKQQNALAEIYSFGHRNAQGLVEHPVTGAIWLHEHGPRGGDEVNIVKAGANYGWPVITHGRAYSGGSIGIGTAKAGMEQPLHVWVPSIAPSGMAFYTGDLFPQWRHDLFVGALAGQVLVRLDIEKGQVIQEERLLERRIGRIRDVRSGPDGALYLLTDSKRGRLFRLEPL